MKYYAQEGQDSIVKQFFDLKNVKNGFFLDVGSLDGIKYSNTYVLEEDGWSGICVEAHPSYFELLRNNRPNSVCYSCAAGNKDKEIVEINLNYRASLSSLDFDNEPHFRQKYSQWYGDRDIKNINGFLNGKHPVEMRTLDSILSDNKVSKLDLITIDIDGSEKYAFQGINIKKYNPNMLILEWSVNGIEFTNNFANSHGYFNYIMVGADLLYVKNEEDYNILQNIKVAGTYQNTPHPCDVR